jgi:hypothetical protein
MKRTLERFEDTFPSQDDTREGHVFKGDLRNMFNDVLRAQRDELHDYEVEFRPLRMTDDNVLAMTPTFLQSVQSIFMEICEGTPCIRIYASPDNAKVLDAVRTEFGTGVVYRELACGEEHLALEIVGVQSCVDSVFPIMDRYCLHSDVRAKYQNWRREVVKLYRGAR